MKKEFFSIKNLIIILETYIIVLLLLYIYGTFSPDLYLQNSKANIYSTMTNKPLFSYSFDVPGTLEESGDMGSSASQYWWVNSGGLMRIENGVGMTVQGELASRNRWYTLYKASNPTDTDSGSHPQNIFRLFTRNQWEDLNEQIYFKINKDNFSQSPNRNISNGVFLISRFKDGDNLYYTGVRVDGTAIIKKKTEGNYFTLAQRQVWGGKEYDRDLNPSLLPKNTWLGMMVEVKNEPLGKVSIKFFMDVYNNGKWSPILEAIDDGKTYGGSALRAAGNGGLRSDFMDIEFKNYQVASLK